ncbi:thiamine pyrophosphate-binding protein [Bacillus sp. T3]|uniref:thiamine pyrophosphate-binding protein n=1 Tax=Bacillus sp. T3 TaxID=467262 RepID=UPI002981A315|nr:thiamine pyrophosphate-binding protein [Bacillus sp. T3]
MIDVKEKTGSGLLVESLIKNGVRDIFGCQSDRFMSFPQIISDYSDAKYIQLKHEQAAVHAADGYARATGKPGVVLLSTASGVTNGVTRNCNCL